MKYHLHSPRLMRRGPEGCRRSSVMVLSCLLLLCSLLTPVSSLGQVRFGAEAGANVNRLSFSKDLFSSDKRVGFFLGPKLCATIPGIGLGFDAAALYSRLPIEINTESSAYGPAADTKALNYIETPINLRWDIGIAFVGIYLATGPQFAWYIGNRTLHNIYTNRAIVFENHLFSWNLGAGFMLGRHIQLGASYNIPVTKAGTIRESIDQTIESGNLRSRTWKLRLNLFF